MEGYWRRTHRHGVPGLRAELKTRGAPQGIVFSPDGALLATGETLPAPSGASLSHGSFYLWDVGTGKLSRELFAAPNLTGIFWGKPCAFSPDGARLVSAGYVLGSFSAPVNLSGLQLQLWDTRTGAALAKLSHADFDAYFLHHYSGANDTALAKAVAAAAKATPKLVGSPRASALSPDGSRLAFIYNLPLLDYRVSVWDLTHRRRLCNAPTHDALALALSPNGRIVYIASDFNNWNAAWGARPADAQGEVAAYSVTTGKLWWRQYYKDWIKCLAVSPDGKTLAAGVPYGGALLLRSADGEAFKRYQPHATRFDATNNEIAFSPDGKTLATFDEEKIYLWNMDSVMGNEAARQ